tara:strand:- start:322 stop:492 length:171 start_codon:yes stop_codon:yes gene_type:complete
MKNVVVDVVVPTLPHIVVKELVTENHKVLVVKVVVRPVRKINVVMGLVVVDLLERT